ncbi:MAG: YicC/YloC family endoribonuclease [Lachnospiraceae bacterium]|nr:YicC/YloC family endoribonuclease [Lachnospiraceae bacterium]
MLKSMTGFGRGEMADDRLKITVEMKSVNHRYLDLGIKMPKRLNAYEATVRNILKEYIQRGKVDVFVSYEEFADSSISLKYNRALAREYMNICRQMQEEFDLRQDASVSMLAKFPEVITMEQAAEDDETVETLLVRALRSACQGFVSAREKEGEQLKLDLCAKLDHMLGLVAKVEERSPQVVQEYRQRLTDKVKELLADTSIDESRILTEVTVFSDKICVDEETVRLATHIRSMKDFLIKGGAVGRKLDFIAQEMNREANTILSKCNDLETSGIAIELKTEIEKVREQIQNIE